MKQIKIPKMVALIGAGAIAILCAQAQTSTTSVATPGTDCIPDGT